MSVWNGLGSGFWSSPGNWIGGIPNSVGATADFTNLAGANVVHQIDTSAASPFIVGTLLLTSSAIERYSLEKGTLVMNKAGGAAITVTSSGIPLSSLLASSLTLQLNAATTVNTAGLHTVLDAQARVTGTELLTKIGSGTLKLSNAASNWSGGTTITAGAIDLHSGAALGTGEFAFSGNAVLRASADMTLANRINVHNGVSATVSAAAAKTLSLTGEFDALGGAGTVLHFGSAADTGTVAFANANGGVGISTGGAISIDGGTVVANVVFRTLTATLAGTNIAAGATLEIDNKDTHGRFAINHLTGSGDITNITSTGATLNVVENGSADFFGKISDGVTYLGLDKNGSGTLTLFGANTYSGFTSINDGVLRAGTINTLSAHSTVNLASTGTLDLQGLDQTVSDIVGSGSIVGNSVETVTVTLTPGLGFPNDFQGVISDGSAVLGRLALTMNGTGGQTLSGINTYTGATHVDLGFLGLNGSGSIEGSSGVFVAAAGTCSTAGSNTASANIQNLVNLGAVTLGPTILNLTHQTGDLGGIFAGSVQDDGLVVHMEATLANFSLAAATFNTWTDATDQITIDGNGLANVMTGSSHADHMFGFEDNDIINGGAGADTMDGGSGNDWFYIDNVLDTVIEAVNGGSDRLLASVSYALAAGQEIELFTTTLTAGTGAINLTGNEFTQTIGGNNGANVIDGKGGADTMQGFGGNDIYYVDNTLDKVIEAVGGGSDRVLTSVNYTLGAGVQVETFTTTLTAGIGALNLTGNEFAQTIGGNAGANYLDGKAGSDTLQGFGGHDSFAFTSVLGATNVDNIADFSVADDTILLAHAIFTGLGMNHVLDASAFFIGSAAGDASDRIVYNSTTGNLYFDDDGSGVHAQQQFAHLSAGLSMTNADFYVA